MAKDVITRFRLETTQFDSKIKSAAKGLSEYTKAASNAGKEFQKFTKDNVAAAQALGKMATSSQDAKGKVNELVGAFNEAAKAYNALTKEQQKSDFGKAMAASLTQLQQRIRETKAEMQSMGNVSKNMGGGFSGVMGNMSKVFGVSPAMLTGIGAAAAAFAGLKEVIGGNISTAMGFEKSMSQLSSLTGMVGKDLEQLKEYAIDLGSTSTLTASQVADAFRLIGSQQPQLLASGEALKEVTKYAITLSEAAGIDLQTAAQTLSTSINQMGGDSNNAARYVNVLAAASQKGAGDIAWLGEAITKSATAAKAVGTDYEELVANLEQLAKAGFDASTAGTALRSIIMNLEKQANQDFKPSIVGLTQAFENLGKANLDIVGYQQIAGKMFASQAMALANAAEEAKNMTVAITGTSTATEQAATNTANLDGSLKALASAWEGLNLHINSSNGLLKDSVDWLKDVVTWVDKAISGMNKYAKRKAEMNNESAGGGNTKIDRMITNLNGTSDSLKSSVYNQQLEQFNRYINKKEAELNKTRNTKDVWAWETLEKNSKIGQLTQDIGAAKQMLDEYKQRAKSIMQSVSKSAQTNGTGSPTITIDVDVDSEEATKSIKDLQEEIKKLKKLRDDAANAGDTKLRDQYNTQIKSVQAQIKSMRGTGNTTTTKNTELDKEKRVIEGMLKDLRKAELKASKIIADERAKEHRTETRGTSGFNEQNIANWTSMMKDQLSKADFGSVMYNQIVENMKDMSVITELTKEAVKRGLNPNELGLTDLFEQAFDNIDVDDSVLQGILDKINTWFKDKPIELNVKTGEKGGKGAKNVTDDVKALTKTAKITADVVGSIGQAFNAIEDPAAKVAGTVAQAIATVAAGYATATAQAAEMGPWAWIAFAASGLAQMLTMISTIHSATGYAEGGIVKGNHYSGDMLDGGSFGINAGELVLNRAQQGSLASQLEGSAGGFRNGQIVGRIEGEKIVLVANRYFRRTGQGEIVTWK